MYSLRIFSLLVSLLLFLVSSCALIQHGDDPNYTICKNLQGKIQFGSDTSYTPEAQSAAADKRRLQATYNKLNCGQYQWLKF